MHPLPLQTSQISRSDVTPFISSYELALAAREMILAANLPLPKYLLAPEVAVLLQYFGDLHQQLIIDTFWNVGGRVNEVLAITPADFHLDGISPFLVLRTLKQRERGKGRPRKDERLHRIIPLSDPQYVRRVHDYLATFKPPKYERLWPMKSDNTVRNWVNAAVEAARRDGVTFTVNPISPKTFRDSFAVHLLMNGIPKAVLQGLLGHKKAETTEIYTKVFALDVSQRAGVRFSMAPEDAMAMLRSVPRAVE